MHPVGLALAGGGLEGAVYEIGALRALDDAVEGLDLNGLHVYVGVSAGSVIASCLANGMTTGQLCRAVADDSAPGHAFLPSTFFRPSLVEWLRRGWMAPRLAVEALLAYARNPRDRTLVGSFMRMARALPVGVFDNEPIRAYLQQTFTRRGRTDDFRELGRRLVVIAADLDSGQAVRFGEQGTDHVPISRAVQASTALPGLYPPVEIDGRHYVDGVLLKTLHASVALDAGARLLLCVNPIVPVDTERSVAAGVMRRGRLVHRGLPTVLSQTFRTLVHSRLTAGMGAYRERYPDADVVLFEPERDDYRMFFTNVFSIATRRAVCEHAYRSVRRGLVERRDELEPVFSRHGLRLRDDVVPDADRGPWERLGLHRERSARGVAAELGHTLNRLERLLGRLEGAPRRTPVTHHSAGPDWR